MLGGSVDDLINDYNFTTVAWNGDDVVEASAAQMLVGANWDFEVGKWQLLFVKFGLSKDSETHVNKFIQEQLQEELQEEDPIEPLDLSAFNKEDY